MSIVIIRGPEHSAHGNALPLVPDVVRRSLTERAAAAGKTVELRICRSEAELVECLRRTRGDQAEFVLLDPGTCVRASAAVRDVLDDLAVPYIEVHDDAPDVPERLISPVCGPRLTWVSGYGAQSYTLALSIALEHLGCSACESEFHVGT
ncbi:type II 3-dehydroquinate dehydratase [Lysobacter cavernae]|uniref:3-dehydroquinate dehydratase n=1 Tax=Lysobacter cavernae TaxID=1685901 RepID=A0ABV7RW64_9GAMM